MKTSEQMAKTLYELLQEDCKGCFDTTVKLLNKGVSYQDQGGTIIVDFARKSITITGEITETFDCYNRCQMGADYVDENTAGLAFFTDKRGETYASLEEEYASFKDLRSVMEDRSVFMEIDLDKVFDD